MSAITPLAHILNKAQGVIDAETGLPIDVGGEVVAIRDELRGQRAEIERLQRKLMLVTNFPSHPGGHPDDQSGDAMVPADWRHGWICAVAAIQEAVAGKKDA